MILATSYQRGREVDRLTLGSLNFGALCHLETWFSLTVILIKNDFFETTILGLYQWINDVA